MVRRDALAAREVAALLDLWRRANEPEARQFLLDHPRDAIEGAARAVRANTDDPHLDQAGKSLLESLVALTQVSLRVQARARKSLTLSAEGKAVIARARARAQSESRAALDAVVQKESEYES